MLSEKSQGTTFYTQYKPSFLKKEKYILIYDRKARSNTTNYYQWWDLR